jgi:hypothetical protein
MRLLRTQNEANKGNMMTERALSDLVSDWGGFEQLVARLHETGNVLVEHNVTLPGKSGAPRQIDVLVRHTEGLYEHLIVVECKYRNAPIERLHVDALATTIREVGASRGVIFSTHGFQSGAITQAQHDNISLFLLREPTDEEWGLPGRHVDIWLQIVTCSIGHLQMPGSLAVNPPPGTSLNLNIHMGDPASTSSTPIKAEGKPDKTLEELLKRMALSSAREAYKPVRMSFDGKFDGDARHLINVNFEPKEPTLLFVDGMTLIAPRITFKLGIKITQSRLQIDRGASYAFVLAVENCISNVITTASRLRGDTRTHLAEAVEHGEPKEPVFESGSIITVWIDPLEPFSGFDNVPPASGPEVNIKMAL